MTSRPTSFATASFAALNAGQSEFARLTAAIEAANAGDTIEILNDDAIGLTGVELDKNGLTFDIAEGVTVGIEMDAATDVTATGQGSLVVQGDASDETINGGDGDDALNGRGGNDTINGGAGDDRLVDGSVGNSEGIDTLNGGAGNDTIAVAFASAGESYDGGAGNDTLDVSLENFGYDTIVLGDAFTNFGATFSGFENVIGSSGADTITGSTDANRIDGRGGADTIVAGGGNDTIDGGAGADTITDADTEIDTIDAGAGNDTVRVKEARTGETFDGGTGFDTLDLSTESRAYAGADAIDLSIATTTMHGATFSNFESVIGTRFGDEITAANVTGALVNGGAGNDVILGGSETETLLGGAGDDRIDAGAGGLVTIDGGTGNDTVFITFAQAGSSYAGGVGVDTLDLINETAGYTFAMNAVDGSFTAYDAAFSGFENVSGTLFADTIGGSDAANLLDGRTGNDVLTGGGGNDVLIDGDAAGADTLDGGDGDDTIRLSVARAGTYAGGEGTDTLDLTGNLAAFNDTNLIDLGAASFTAHGATFSGFENVTGGKDEDRIAGSNGANIIDGGAGFDVIIALGGDDIIIDADVSYDGINAGNGDDIVRTNAAGTGFALGGAGTDTLDLSTAQLAFVGIDLSAPDFTEHGTLF